MQTNMGAADRVLRAVLGVVLILLPFVAGLPWWVAVIGLVPLATAALRSCPVYSLLGIRTCRTTQPGP
jgi:hypothetical protein